MRRFLCPSAGLFLPCVQSVCRVLYQGKSSLLFTAQRYNYFLNNTTDLLPLHHFLNKTSLFFTYHFFFVPLSPST